MHPDQSTLASYIAEQRSKGVTDEQLSAGLLSSGWPPETVRQALVRNNPALPVAPQAGLFSGRIGRAGFVVGIIYGLAIFVVPLIVQSIGTAATDTNRLPILNVITILISLVGIILIIPISISLHVRRWHDLDQSGWLTLLGFVPFIGLIVTIVLFVLPGSKDTNTYGQSYAGTLSPSDIFSFR